MPGARAPEAGHCQYGGSRLQCRGPQRPLDGPYVAFLGGAETFGRFVAVPFVEQVERVTGRICVNLGAAHAGPDAWLFDPDLLAIADRAEQAVIQLPGAQGLSNPFYRVHPRRNDRFLEALPVLKAIYPEIDFSDFTFVNHMLGTLNRCAPARFAAVRDDLKQVWVERMLLVLRRFQNRPALLWLRYNGGTLSGRGTDLGSHPLFVDEAMVDRLRPVSGEVIALDLDTAAAAKEVKKMRFGSMQAPAAAQMIGPSAHKLVAKALLEVVTPAD